MLKTSILPQLASSPSEFRLRALQGGEQAKAWEQERLEKVAKEFETLLVEMMIKSMRQNVPEPPLFGENTGREIFQDMLDGEYAQLMVSRRGFGIAESLIRQLKPKL